MKPKLSVIRPGATARDLARLYESITGKKPTAAEIRAAQALMDKPASIPPRAKG